MSGKGREYDRYRDGPKPPEWHAALAELLRAIAKYVEAAREDLRHGGGRGLR